MNPNADKIIARAEAIWTARYPNRSTATWSAAMGIGRLLNEATRQLRAEGAIA